MPEQDRMKEQNYVKAYIAEAVGTFILVFSIIASVTLYVGPATEAGVALPNFAIPFIALAHFLGLFIGIQSLGAISGGHFNPGVTIGLLAIRKIRAREAGIYVIAQVIGATLAAFILALALHKQGQAVKFGSPALAEGVSVGSGMVLEALMMFIFVWTIVATAVNPRGTKEWAPAAISLSLALGVLLIGTWTGASLNPARAFGPDLTNALFGSSGGFGSLRDFLLVYLIAPITAGVLAATLYNSLFIQPAERGELPEPPPAPSEQSPF